MLNEAKNKMEKVIDHLNLEFSKVRTGRASVTMLDSVKVEVYGSLMPLNQVALLTTPEASQIMVKPFDPTTLKDIEKTIIDSNLGLNPNNDGEVLRINIPMLTEETRKTIVKDVKKIEEENKISIRNIRQQIKDEIKKDTDMTEDEKKSKENKLQELVNKYNGEIEKLVSEKEKEVLTI